MPIPENAWCKRKNKYLSVLVWLGFVCFLAHYFICFRLKYVLWSNLLHFCLVHFVKHLKITKFFQTAEGAVKVVLIEAHTVQLTFVHVQIMNLTFFFESISVKKD